LEGQSFPDEYTRGIWAVLGCYNLLKRLKDSGNSIMEKIKTNYTPEKYTLENERAIVGIGSKPGEFYPYDLLLGALSSCFYYTLYEILEKRKVEIPIVEIVVTGEKRTETPTTLEWVNLDITVTGNVDEKQFLRSVDLAGKYCSIHTTISKVAKMSHEVKFNPLK